ncbi:MAG: tetratricopeptide repeat protein [Candidatus Hydrogenedentes bacterium]|nr:tetratricopeptide repeat protein [Candidatus Hydrogenedentota bacterium]
MSQEKEHGAEEKQRGEADIALPMSQDELDALLSTLDDKPVPSPSSGSADASPDAPPANGASAPHDFPADVAPEPDAVSLEETDNQAADIDGLLGKDSEQPLVNHDLDEMLPAAPTAAGGPDAEGVLGQSEIDDLLASLQGVSAPASAAPPAPPPQNNEDDSAITQDVLAALMNAGNDVASAGASITNENLAAAVPPDETDESAISQDILDALTKEAAVYVPPQERSPQVVAAVPEAQANDSAALPEPKSKIERSQAPREERSRAPEQPPEGGPLPGEPPSVRMRRQAPRSAVSLLKIVSSLAAGIIIASGTYVYLVRHQEVTPDLGAVAPAQKSTDLRTAMTDASAKLKAEAYSDAIALIDPAIAANPKSPDLIDAQYLRAEAKVRELGILSGAAQKAKDLPVKATALEGEKKGEGTKPAVSRGEALDSLLGDLDKLTHSAPDHPKVEQALLWQARINDLQDNPIEARRIYNEVLEKFATTPDLDHVLLAASKTAIKLRLGPEAVALLSRLTHDIPGSPLAGEAHVLLGDAYALSGDAKNAKSEYDRIVEAQPDTALGAEAYARLGQLAYDGGDFLEAIHQLEKRLSSATTIQGNEPVYLMLARSYKSAGKLKEAERVVRELLDFFEPGDTTPAAFVLLCEILDAEGQRDEAKRLASQTSLRYPENPMALANEGRLLGESGEFDAAGKALMAADAAGANDPNVLLAAGKYFRQAEQFPDAKTALEKLEENYGGQPEAFEGNIELSKTLYDMGKIRDGLQRLEDLSTATEGKPQRLPVLLALGKMYQDLGLDTRAAGILREASFLTAEPEVLAKAATALLSAGLGTDGLSLAGRVDVSKLKGKSAYEFLSRYGEALLRTDSSKAIEKMEEAYASYPEERTERGDQKLLEAYLTTDRSARARALVMDIEALARRKPVEHARLERAANAWGNYLYARGDFRAAADAYALSENGADPASTEAQWAAYQRANALRRLSDFSASEAIYDKISKGTAAWKENARVKSEYVRLQERLRENPLALTAGEPVTP